MYCSIAIIVYAYLSQYSDSISCNDNFWYVISNGYRYDVAFEVLVNVGMTIGIMPVTGIPLPFLSYGVSALTTNMLSIGILLNIARQRTKYIF